ncbi:MAG TPA: hypothetical protein VMH83_12320 [Candidatus Acidoferrum sp.]|nr:hypothetical protein [Candidatus Acidoferrum sp.]
MLSKKSIYIGAVVTFVASVIAILIFPYGTLFSTLASVPLIGSLFAALFQILRDVSSYERQILLQESQQRFALGASSHMANVAFDRHAAFADEYICEVFKTLDTLFKHGPTEEAFPHAGKLLSIRKKYAVWLTPEIDKMLQAIEGALRTVGANKCLLMSSIEGEARQKVISEMYKVFADILGKENMGSDTWQGVALSDEVAIAGVIQGLRIVLGTAELTKIRSALIDKALQNIK